MKKNIYCVEFYSTDKPGLSRVTVSALCYNTMQGLDNMEDKIRCLDDYFSVCDGSLNIKEIVRQFITTNDNIMIGYLDGENIEF